MRLILDIPEDEYKRYKQYYDPYRLKEPVMKEDDCSCCKGCGWVEVSHPNQCYSCGGTGKKTDRQLNITVSGSYSSLTEANKIAYDEINKKEDISYEC